MHALPSGGGATALAVPPSTVDLPRMPAAPCQSSDPGHWLAQAAPTHHFTRQWAGVRQSVCLVCGAAVNHPADAACWGEALESDCAQIGRRQQALILPEHVPDLREVLPGLVPVRMSPMVRMHIAVCAGLTSPQLGAECAVCSERLDGIQVPGLAGWEHVLDWGLFPPKLGRHMAVPVHATIRVRDPEPLRRWW